MLEALEAEAFTLRRVDTIASTADGYLAIASDLLTDNAGLEAQLANTAGLAPGEAEALRIQVAANQQSSYAHHPHRRLRRRPAVRRLVFLQVGGGKLQLPDLASSAPTRQPVLCCGAKSARSKKTSSAPGSKWSRPHHQRRPDPLDDTRHRLRPPDAELLRNQTLAQAGTAAADVAHHAATVGSLLDLTA